MRSKDCTPRAQHPLPDPRRPALPPCFIEQQPRRDANIKELLSKAIGMRTQESSVPTEPSTDGKYLLLTSRPHPANIYMFLEMT